MFFILSKIAGFLLDPSHVAIFLCAIGAALLYTRWRRLGRALTTLGALLLLLMGFGPIGHWLAAPLEARFPAPPDDMPAPDGIIVLGGSPDEALSAQLNRPVISDAAERLTAPIALKRKY
ncbi:MAG: YdcF family protein, partial [Methylocystis sp.]|nr:YdcF family protein [Methylocystis sp.]